MKIPEVFSSSTKTLADQRFGSSSSDLNRASRPRQSSRKRIWASYPSRMWCYSRHPRERTAINKTPTIRRPSLRPTRHRAMRLGLPVAKLAAVHMRPPFNDPTIAWKMPRDPSCQCDHRWFRHAGDGALRIGLVAAGSRWPSSTGSEIARRSSRRSKSPFGDN